MEIDCNTCKNFKKSLSNNSLSMTVVDIVLSHLYNCKECRQFFSDYYKQIGKAKFNIYKEMFKYLVEYEKSDYGKQSRVKDIIYSKPILKQKYEDYKSNKWFNYAKEGNVPKLTNIRAFKDIMDYEVSLPDNEEEREKIVDCLYRYGLYEAEKIAKKVDMLERCLVLEYNGGSDD